MGYVAGRKVLKEDVVPLPTWTTVDEVCHLRCIAAGKGCTKRARANPRGVIEGYLRGIPLRHDWAGIDKQKVVAEAENLLRVLHAKETE